MWFTFSEQAKAPVLMMSTGAFVACTFRLGPGVAVASVTCARHEVFEHSHGRRRLRS